MDITMCTSSTADFTKLCAEKDYQCMWVIKDGDVVVNDVDSIKTRC